MPKRNLIFVSHSKEDPSLKIIKKAFDGTTYHPVLIELEKSPKKDAKYVARRILNSSGFILLISTILDKKPHTASWISFELGIASTLRKKILVLERKNVLSKYCVPYLNAYAIYNPDNKTDVDILRKKIKRWPSFIKFGRKVKCLECGNKFWYHSISDRFCCPICRKHIIVIIRD